MFPTNVYKTFVSKIIFDSLKQTLFYQLHFNFKMFFFFIWVSHYKSTAQSQWEYESPIEYVVREEGDGSEIAILRKFATLERDENILKKIDWINEYNK